MATIDRIEPSYAPWSPSASGFGSTATEEVVDGYIGRHRRPGGHRLALLHMFHRGKHRRRH